MAPRTLLGPLTTPFTYPASCLNNVLSCTTASDCTVGWQEQTCGVNPANSQGIGENTNCWPPVTNGVTQAQPYAVLGWGFYSPAYSCPVGYSTACSAYGGQNGGFDFQFELLAGETAVGCCPTGYTCGSLYTFSNFQTCISVVTTGIITTVQCSEEQSVSPGFFHVPATVTSAGTAEMISSVTLYAPLFQLNQQATNTATGSMGSPSTASTGSSGATATSNRGGGGLSAGAAGGIGAAGGVVAVLAIGVLIWLLWMRRMKNVTTGPEISQAHTSSDLAPAQKPELDTSPAATAIHGDPTNWTQSQIAEVPAVPACRMRDIHEAP